MRLPASMIALTCSGASAGAGQWVTTYANAGHSYMVVAGLRFDTSGRAEDGSRWHADMRSADGIVGPATWSALGHSGRSIILKRRGHRDGSHRSRADRIVARVVAAGNRIASKPYKYGGGHGRWVDSGYDCSGSVSYALHGAGLLSMALDSSGFMRWGAPGRGRRITIYANPGHVYMVVDGRRFDTTGRTETGSRWQSDQRSAAGYVVRHPPGL